MAEFLTAMCEGLGDTLMSIATWRQLLSWLCCAVPLIGIALWWLLG